LGKLCAAHAESRRDRWNARPPLSFCGVVQERLGLWGTHSGYSDFASFVDGITARGVGGLEMLAMEMKSTGTYVSRGLSYEQA